MKSPGVCGGLVVLNSGNYRNVRLLRRNEFHIQRNDPMTLSYATTFCPRPNRPTMISAKYRQKEERRKVLKISINKLKKIEDPESSLRRSVLINNTMKRLQCEAREEKMQQKQVKEGVSREQQLADITNLPKKEEMEMDAPLRRRKRSLIDEDDESEDVQAVLSQFYMPLTPHVLTSIEEDENDDGEIVNVVDVDRCSSVDGGDIGRNAVGGGKKLKLDFDRLSDSDGVSGVGGGIMTSQSILLSTSPSATSTVSTTPSAGAAAAGSAAMPTSTSTLSSTEAATAATSFTADQGRQFSSCGHSTIFTELQSVVYHSLIASLEA